ncbi:MAG: hypothetical protein COV67_03040 [Nitrospinae bacterium CG11_big_fil_rev_8_21_14_0_20_56_8]|nr:MAG: hypothetical protein COV67_03040 [Nitrospinae bacterium CG11_big_fil_rev_8_21_14_0_20_56_8]
MLRGAVREHRIHWHQHALERFLERGILRAEVLSAIMQGEVIENYPEDRPYPSCLILNIGEEPVHVVAAVDPEGEIGHIITAYRPDSDHFERDFKTRRPQA